MPKTYSVRSRDLALLEKAFSAGDTVSPTVLVERKLISTRRSASFTVKVLGTGELTKKLIIEKCLVSATAKEKIEKVGGSIASQAITS